MANPVRLLSVLASLGWIVGCAGDAPAHAETQADVSSTDAQTSGSESEPEDEGTPPELVLEDLQECVVSPASGDPDHAYVTSPQGWQVKTQSDPKFECGPQFSSVEYRAGLVGVITAQPAKGDDAPAAQQVSGFAAHVRASWQKKHRGAKAPKLLGHKVGKDKRPAVCLELPEPEDEAVKIGCVTAQRGPKKDAIIYHYVSFYLKLADYDANRDAAWEEVRDLAGEWSVIGNKGR